MSTDTKQPVVRTTHNLDATGVPLGRLASKVATLLQGKHKPTWKAHVDVGDIVHITHADKVKLTGKKLSQKVYYRHSGYPGSIKSATAEEILRGPHPHELVRRAVFNMLPKNKQRAVRMKRLRFE